MKKLIGVSCFLLMGLSWQVGAYDERDLQELLETKDCEMCDLTSVDLSGKDLSGANLTGADLTKANLTKAKLTKANLSSANLTGADLTKANLTKANLNAADLTAANLKDAKGFNTSENADWYPYVGFCLTIMPDGSTNNSVCERMYKHEREWRILAEEGYAYAQARLGKLYKNGDCVPQDDKAALKWFTLAVEQGNAEGQYGLGSMYWYGEGVPQDHKAALKWFTLAVEQGNADAMDRLGFMYAGGVGVRKDYVYAYMWEHIAASIYRDNDREIEAEYVSKDRDQIAKRMTPAEIAKAKKLARECIAKKYKGC